MKATFKKGDRVFDIRFGWGTVSYIYTTDLEKEKDQNLVCVVKFEKEEEVNYTKFIALKLLSFTEYTLRGFNQKHNEDYSKHIGKWCIFKDSEEDALYINKLRSFDVNGFFQDSEDISWNICEPLTEEQIKILNLE